MKNSKAFVCIFLWTFCCVGGLFIAFKGLGWLHFSFETQQFSSTGQWDVATSGFVENQEVLDLATMEKTCTTQQKQGAFPDGLGGA